MKGIYIDQGCERMYECMCVCSFYILYYSSGEAVGCRLYLSSEFKIDQVDFKDRMPFLLSSLIEKISPNSQALSPNT